MSVNTPVVSAINFKWVPKTVNRWDDKLDHAAMCEHDPSRELGYFFTHPRMDSGKPF
jgi:hypothetical protein